MNKNHIPFACAKSIYDVDVSFYKAFSITTLFVDLDNTLDSYKQATATNRAKELKQRLEKEEIRIIIVSNNTSKRVSLYANSLGVEYVNSIGKPFALGLNRAMKRLGLKKERVMLIGDQTTTDVPCGNRAGIKTLLVDKLVDEDQWTTKFNRIFDKRRREKLKKQNLLIDWRNK